MRPFEDVILCCETEEPLLRLPSNEFELSFFLLEDGMERLLAFRVSAHKPLPLSLSTLVQTPCKLSSHTLLGAYPVYGKKVQVLVSNSQRLSTPRGAEVTVESLSMSVHVQTPLQSGLGTFVHVQLPASSLVNTPADAQSQDRNSTAILTREAVAGNTAEWIHASLQTRPSTLPPSTLPYVLSLRTHLPTFYTPTKPK